MRSVRNLAVPLAVAMAAFISFGQATSAHASSAGVLRVDNSATSHCSDSTADSSVAPYCTIQAAVGAARPGDTVAVKPGDIFTTETDVTASGTADAPITIDGGGAAGAARGAIVSTASTYGFNISGAQYIDLKGFDVVRAAEDDVLVENSQNVTVSGMFIAAAGATPAARGVDLASSPHSTVETSQFSGPFQWGVAIGGYATSDTVTTNMFFGVQDGISDVAVPDVAITSNTLEHLCGEGIIVEAGEAGLATGSTIENNVLSNFTCASTAILGDSQETADADYNVIYPDRTGSEDYYWSASPTSTTANYYTSPAQFCAAVGQGCHDLANDPALSLGLNQGQIGSDASSAVDSADANARGELPTDLIGRPRVDDLNVADTGTGSATYYDRGAYEYQDPFAGSSIGISGVATGAYSVAPNFTAGTHWGAVTTTVDYGDGTTAVTNPTARVHRYARLGTYTITATMIDATGAKAAGTTTFTTAGSEFTPFGPTRLLDTRNGTGGTSGRILGGQVVSLAIDGAGSLPAAGITAVALTVTATGSNASGYVSPANARETSLLNYSAGRTIANFAIMPVINGQVQLYVAGPATAGTYLVADVTGYFTGSMASGYTAVPPARLLDTRNGTGARAGSVAGGTHIVLTIAGADKGALPSSGLKAVALNLTATGGTGSSYVTAYPDGGARPVSSNLNFVTGQTIAAAAIVPVGSDGKIDLYVGGSPSQTVNLVADVSGYYSPSSTAAYVPIVPDRVIDTRKSGGPLANDATVIFDPANVVNEVAVLPGGAQDAYYVLPRDALGFDFNLTVTQPTGGGVVTAYPYESQSTPIPAVSNLNYVRGQTIANFAQTTSGPAGFDGSVDISPNRAAGTVQLIADLYGLYSAN